MSKTGSDDCGRSGLSPLTILKAMVPQIPSTAANSKYVFVFLFNSKTLCYVISLII